ncbi:hypothetical protein BJ170DRAFT_410700 [Xylariales sp. AK1849]|nr:hypothetical protein BJ170DRAFT_410700 [Xylariales sp. AK1849]
MKRNGLSGRLKIQLVRRDEVMRKGKRKYLSDLGRRSAPSVRCPFAKSRLAGCTVGRFSDMQLFRLCTLVALRINKLSLGHSEIPPGSCRSRHRKGGSWGCGATDQLEDLSSARASTIIYRKSPIPAPPNTPDKDIYSGGDMLTRVNYTHLSTRQKQVCAVRAANMRSTPEDRKREWPVISQSLFSAGNGSKTFSSRNLHTCKILAWLPVLWLSVA